MAKTIKLPVVEKDMAFPLMQSLAQRRSVRRWEDRPISRQDISNLLWAACGITKEAKGKAKSKRTAPSACNAQEIRIFVLIPEGVFKYDEVEHGLIQIHDKDEREHIGTQKMMKSAPMGLVYVADLSRMTSPYFRSDEAKRLSAWVDTGFISQNVYLYCTAAGMGSVALLLINRDNLREALRLKEHEKIVMTQAVGYLKK